MGTCEYCCRGGDRKEATSAAEEEGSVGAINTMSSSTASLSLIAWAEEEIAGEGRGGTGAKDVADQKA